MSQDKQGEPVEPATDTGQPDTVTVKKNRKRSQKSKIFLRDKKIVQLLAEKRPKREIAKAVGCSPDTVYNVLRKYRDVFPEIDNVQDYQKVRGQLLSATEFRLLKSLNDENKIAKASLNQAAYAARQVHDMRRLEDGLSTKNIETHVRHTRQSLPSEDITE